MSPESKPPRLKIAVTGLAATYPFGGVFWDYMQYVLGLHRLGHDVLYIEDTGRECYDPEAQTFVADASCNALRLQAALAALDPALGGRWFLRDANGHSFGRSWFDVVRFLRDADLLINLSASCRMREEYFACQRLAFVDTDPMYTQAPVPAYLAGTAGEDERQRVEMLRHHDSFFTFGENIGGLGCRIPTELFSWIPTRQPIVLSCFETERVPIRSRRCTMTSVASWDAAKGPVIDGTLYTGKSTEFLRFEELPARSLLPLELAMSGPAPHGRLRAHGWNVIDAWNVTSNPWQYRSYLGRSLGECSVARNAYVAGRTGWFSCRSACYLALAVPVVVQDTGFSATIPTGEGVFAFHTVDEAAEAIRRVAGDPERHARAAADIAREYFAADRVLPRLLDHAMNASPGPQPASTLTTEAAR